MNPLSFGRELSDHKVNNTADAKLLEEVKSLEHNDLASCSENGESELEKLKSQLMLAFSLISISFLLSKPPTVLTHTAVSFPFFRISLCYYFILNILYFPSSS